MKKVFVFISVFFLVSNFAFSQNAESPVPYMDEAVVNLSRAIQAKLTEKRAEKIVVGQFTFQNGNTSFSSYWVNQLTGELANMPGRTYTVYSSGVTDAQWTITGEIVVAADTIRVYSRLIRLSDRAIEASFYSNFRRSEQINSMLVLSGSSASGGMDSYEPDSWENPVAVSIGDSPTTPVMNRAIDSGDEDFFLIVPDRDGRLTAETTGSTDTYMYLYNYDTEEELASNDDGGSNTNARITFNVRSGTRYLAVVRGYSDSTAGSYGFRAYMVVRDGDGGWENPVVFEIGTGEDTAAIQRNLQPEDEFYFLLVPDRNGRLTIETIGRTDTYMELYDAGTKELLEENDDGGNNTNARIRYNVRAGNRYIAMVRGYDSSVRGSFGFRAFFGSGLLARDEYEPDDEPSQAKQIEIGASQERTFHSGDDVDWVFFNVARAGRYVINARGINSNRLDTYIELFDSNFNLIAEDDDGGDSLSSRLSVNLGAGVYYIKVWCLDEDPEQGYILSVTQ
ncbi:MAG: PPC domain-containing protein [Treponema sp.]|jgi:hypothetical protein|nr:PPC domain-containing protein [Treponema sp.]